MQIINSNIKDVKYRDRECEALYFGTHLIWRRSDEESNDILNVTSSNPTYSVEIGNETYTFNSNQDYKIDIEEGYAVNFKQNDTSILRINRYPSLENCESAFQLFFGLSECTDISPLKISEKCKSLENIYNGTTAIGKIDLSKWDMTNVTSLGTC